MKEQRIDLHCHSIYSDGTCTPEEIVAEAKRIGLSAIALTDHDNLNGIHDFLHAGLKYGIETIIGIELSSTHKRFHWEEVHIVGLGVNLCSLSLNALMRRASIDRSERNHALIESLNDIGCDITYEEVQSKSKWNFISRSDFAEVLLERGFVKTRSEAFEKYLSANCPYYPKLDHLSSKDIINIIHEAGGVAILAHPTLYHLTNEQIESLVSELKSYGLDGIEVEYTTYTPEQAEFITSLADKYSLLYSGGSDFHGTRKQGVSLGVGKGNLKIPYSYWSALKERCTYP